MSYTTNVRVHAIISDGSVKVIDYNFTTESAAYHFYLRIRSHPHVDYVEFPRSNLEVFTSSDEALSHLDAIN